MKRANYILPLLLMPGIACAQKPATLPPADADIPRIVKEIRADRIERTIRALVGFGTRNTLSTQDDPKRGIGAARDWLFAEFTKLRESSGGRLVVEKQTFVQPVSQRVPRPTTLTNIVAILPGDLPVDRRRYLIVSGHYDSICTSPTDAEHDAPGANDDASGSAAVLEMARAMAPYRFPATLVFVCVAGEEQGLLGSTYCAEQAKQQNWRVEAIELGMVRFPALPTRSVIIHCYLSASRAYLALNSAMNFRRAFRIVSFPILTFAALDPQIANCHCKQFGRTPLPKYLIQ